ncbi:MAG: EAL domain-containing protein [Lachnospiraceae bacterium]|nr:EAL domain-containing protein [Lachnospiraceae bacterium]
MFTWNFQYVSKARLAETFNQLMLNSQKGDILIRIHTAIHLEDEAVDLARFIKNMVPGACIFGTSTSDIISWGKLVPNQCVISVTQMSPEGHIRSAMLPLVSEDTGEPLSPDELCGSIKEAVYADDTKLMLTFLTEKYPDIYNLIDSCNDHFPGVQMIGGIANSSGVSVKTNIDSGFVFNEDGWSDNSIIIASIGGSRLESFSSYATGAQVIGEDCEITDAIGSCILSIDGKHAAKEYRAGIGDQVREKPELASLFPYVYSDTPDIPVFVSFYDDKSLSEVFPDDDPKNKALYREHPGIDRNKETELLCATHNVRIGKKLRRAFIYDRKIISDNRTLFQRVENFEKAETLFGYSCVARSMIYSNCVKWELSAYENSNMCGCITGGEIAYVNGRNTFANCAFVVSVLGEEEATPEYNPYVFSHTGSLTDDNRELLSYLMEIETMLERDEKYDAADSLRSFVRTCELKLLFSENEDLPNAAALNMDMKLKGYDRICMVSVSDISNMKAVFPEHMIDLTYRNYIHKCSVFARKKDYRFYIVSGWTIAIGAPSYIVKLSCFVSDMEQLQRELFETSEDYIAIVPVFCVLDDSSVDNLNDRYNQAKVEMAQKNIQFDVYDASADGIDEEAIRERYQMVNIINYAIAHDKVIPYYQGIYDNRLKCIHHYESLMRIVDENGKVRYPAEFLDVARTYGLLYDSISEKMIRKVFEKFRKLPDRSVSINLGLRDIKNRKLVEYIYEFLPTVEHPENFIFEILENEDIDDYEYMLNFVDKIHSLGGLIAIDDFGSGYSNLQHVVSIHSDYLKIDGSIVKKCCDDTESENLIALISGWKKLSGRKVEVIAEYVETGDIQNKLNGYGIDYSQGYLFSEPSPEIEGK